MSSSSATFSKTNGVRAATAADGAQHTDTDNPNEVFERLSDMFGMLATAQVILDIGTQNQWKLENCIDAMIRYSNSENTSDTAVDLLVNLDISNVATKQHNGLHYESAHNGLVDAPPPFKGTPQSTPNKSIQNILSLSSSGTIPKTPKPSTFQAPAAMSSFLKHGSNQFTEASPAKSKPPKMPAPNHSPETLDCIRHIASGHKVMVIMRGAPGSGKSHLARALLEQTLPGANPASHIYSSDDYFIRANGAYQFDAQSVPDAHEFNQRSVRNQATLGWSPIIVDNTMIRVWEMHCYVDIAVRHGYLICILESNMPWRYSAGQLAQRNVHGVRKVAIERMLRSFEHITVEALLRNPQFKYSMSVPQPRVFPPLGVEAQVVTPSVRPSPISFDPKPQRVRATATGRAASAETATSSRPQDPKDTFQIAAQKLQQLGNEWTSFEKEQGEFWTTSSNASDASQSSAKAPDASSVRPSTMIELLRDHPATNVPAAATSDALNPAAATLEKHRIDCTNENPVFAHIRQIYPAVPGSYLWDLFKNCNGDPEWTLDILLKEETRVEQYENAVGAANELCCGCDRIGSDVTAVPPTAPDILAGVNASVSAKISKRDRLAYQNLEVRRQIEESIVIDDTHYTEHTRKIRKIRYGNNVSPEAPTSDVQQAASCNGKDTDVQMDRQASSSDEAGSSDTDSRDYIEINLGREVIDQLESMLGMETIPTEHIIDPGSLKTNVFMPKVLAQQLYALWMESMYNQMEEQRLQTVRADEEFARQLFVQQQQKTAAAVVAPPAVPKMSLKDVVEMECAWANYNAQQPSDAWKDSTDLATKITHGKLTETFPDIEADTLRDVLAANNNRFTETLDMLNRMLPTGQRHDVDMAKTTEELLNRAQLEADKVDNTFVEDTLNKANDTVARLGDGIVGVSKKIDPSEAKRFALSTFEECRNKAMHHTQMKAECYNKCKSAMQRGEGSVAVYYSRVANLHKARIDHFNHLASNCIMEVHNLTQTSPDILDLHYLYVTEAIECLDLFLDKHLSRLRAVPQPYKSLLVITGRGLHSTGGFSTIKQRTKYRLKERGLNWSEVNPGLLRIKIFPNSYLSMDV